MKRKHQASNEYYASEVMKRLLRIFHVHFCGESRSVNEKNVRAAAAKITCKINSPEDKDYVKSATREWRQLAQDIQHSRLISVIGTNEHPAMDLRAAEVFYDLNCYRSAKRKQSRKCSSSNPNNSSNEDFIKLFALKQIVSHIASNQNETTATTSFKLVDLGAMFANILSRYGLSYEYQSLQFFELLKSELPELKKFHHGQGAAVYVSLQNTIDKAFFEPVTSREEYEVTKFYNELCNSLM